MKKLILALALALGLTTAAVVLPASPVHASGAAWGYKDCGFGYRIQTNAYTTMSPTHSLSGPYGSGSRYVGFSYTGPDDFYQTWVRWTQQSGNWQVTTNGELYSAWASCYYVGPASSQGGGAGGFGAR